MNIKILILQLDKTEKPGFIKKYLDQAHYEYVIVQVFKKIPYIKIKDFTHLIVLPSPKDTFECNKYSYLKFTKKIIKKFISNKKYVLGVCMGCQLIAECLGEKITKMKKPEIGFYKLNHIKKTSLLKGITQNNFVVFEWHSMQVSTHKCISIMANTNNCKIQIFQYKNFVFGIQFHLEIDPSLADLYLQKFDAKKNYSSIRKETRKFYMFNKIQKKILNNFFAL